MGAMKTMVWLGMAVWLGCSNPAERFSSFPAASVTSEDYCNQHAAAVCARLPACYPLAYDALARGSGCQSEMTLQCQQQYAEAFSGVAAGRVTFVAAAAQSCIQQWPTLPCHEQQPQVCTQVFAGARGGGGRCATLWDCNPAHFCNVDSPSCKICFPRFPSAHTCTRHIQCEAGLRCIAGQCDLPVGEDQSCMGDAQACDDGLVCTQDTGVCMRPGAANADCRLAPCLAPLVCLYHDNSATCVPAAAEGQACHAGGEGAPPCQDQGRRLVCDGQCRAVVAAAPGEACDSVRRCAADGVCNQGVCTALPVAGQACQDNVGCFQAVCTEGTCAAASVFGQDCTDTCQGLQCVDGICDAQLCNPREPVDGGTTTDGGGP